MKHFMQIKNETTTKIKKILKFVAIRQDSGKFNNSFFCLDVGKDGFILYLIYE